MQDAYDIWENASGGARFYLMQSDANSTYGALVLLSDAELAREQHAKATVHLLQTAGECHVAELDSDGNIQASHVLLPGNYLALKAGQAYACSNPNNEESVTLFKADGDASEFVTSLKHKFTKIGLHQAD